MKKLLPIILIVLTLSSYSQNSCMPFWNNLQTIVITNPNASILTNYQVKLSVNTQSLISATQMNINGDDIRFATTSCNNIPYYIESGINTTTTSIWVKVPLIPASGTVAINMYFNNPSALAQSNGDLVFNFFDDFNDGVFNTTKWLTQGTPGILTEAGGKLTFGGNNNWEYIKSSTTFTSKLTVETNYKMTGPSGGLLVGIGGTDNRFTFRVNSTNLGTTFDPDVIGGNAWFNTNYPAIAAPTSTFDDLKLAVEMLSNTINISDFCNLTQASCNLPITPLTSATGLDYYLGFSTYASSYLLEVDIIKAREYAPIEPGVVIGATALNPYIFTNALLKPNFCANETTTVSIVSNGTFNTGNIYSAEISDAFGSFISPTSIGSLASIGSGSLSLTATIPSTLVAGTAYRIRGVSSNQVITGLDNGINFTVTPAPVVTASSNANLICSGQSATITAGGATTFTWNTSVSTTVIVVSPTITTSYTVNGTDANGCENSAVFTQSVSACTGLASLEKAGDNTLSIYPNPSKGDLMISANSETTLSIVNNLGQVVKIISITAANNYKASVTDLANGIYFITSSENKNIKQKIVVSK